MADWPGTPSGQVATRWPGTPTQAAPQQTKRTLVPQPDPATAGQPSNPILIQAAPKTFYEGMTQKAGEGVEQIKKAVTEPRVAPTAVPELLGGFMKILESPFEGMSVAAEEKFPALKEAQKQGQILPLERPGDIAYGALGMGGTKPLAAFAKAPEAGLLRKLISPASVSPEAESMAGGIRKATGTSAQSEQATRDALSRYEANINALKPEQQLDLLNYIESPGTAAKPATRELQQFADVFKTEMDKRKYMLANATDIEREDLIENYVTHFWKDPQAARQFTQTWSGKQGSSRFTKERTIPTIAEGIKAGLEPVTTNPIQIAAMYTASMDRWLAMKEMLKAGETAGDIKYFTPGRAPEGWVPLDGRLAQKGNQTVAHAPEHAARVYNRFVSEGFTGVGKEAVDTIRKASNMATQSVLGLSGFHALAMAKHAVHSELAIGQSEIIGGIKTAFKGALKRDVQEILRGGALATRGAAHQVTAFAAPVYRAYTGSKIRDVYLGRTQGSPDYRHLVKLLTEAGGRGAGKKHTLDYEFSTAGNFLSAWRRASLKQELRQAGQSIAESKHPVFQTAKVATEIIGRAFETISDPLFKHYIPLVKNGVFQDTMSAWLRANPTASYDEQLAVARKVIDSIDNRMGEVIHDNIFWHTLAKQIAAIGLLSYSWNLGKIREFIGGAGNLAKTAGKSADITAKEFDPRAGYVLAIPMAMATANGIYQYAKTGMPPESAHDLMAPATGGVMPSGAEERAILPGDEKEIFGWYNLFAGNTPPSQELYNKANPLIRLGVDFMRQKDWADKPFVPPDPTLPEWLKAYMMHAVEAVKPITGGRLYEGEKTGSEFHLPEEILGIKEAPASVLDPEGFATRRGKRERYEWSKKQKFDRKRQSQYGGPQE